MYVRYYLVNVWGVIFRKQRAAKLNILELYRASRLTCDQVLFSLRLVLKPIPAETRNENSFQRATERENKSDAKTGPDCGLCSFEKYENLIYTKG